MNKFFLTTPIYYVNARPHLGHAYTSILADSLTRLRRLAGEEARMLTGTDEHGDKIVKAAEKANMAPQPFTDSISAEFRAILPELNVQNSYFVRTTDAGHVKAVQAFLQKVHDNGDIYFGEYGGHYCYGCERFYTEKELENGLCPQHLVKPEYVSEKNYFFRMSKYQGWLKQYILDNPDFIRPERYRNEALALLEGGVLEDLCISRPKSRLTWGIDLPFDNNYVCYVWFDALIGYISPLLQEGALKDFWPNAEHLIAKDILKPHAIFWPIMLKAAGLEPCRHLNVHGYWLVRETKMSKSLGNVVDPVQTSKVYGLDAFRYFLLREMHFGGDASFSEDALVARLNADLANDLGNLFSRVLSMAAKYLGGKTPQYNAANITEEERKLAELAENSFRNYLTLCKGLRFSAGLESLWELVRSLNKYVDSSAPWALFKAQDLARLNNVLYTLLEYLRKTALFLWPVMPETAEKMLAQLGQPFKLEDARLEEEITSFGSLKAGTALAEASNLFPRVDVKAEGAGKNEDPAKQVKEEKKAAKKTDGSGSQKTAGQAAGQATGQAASQAASQAAGQAIGPIDFADFQKLDLRAGTVTACAAHPDADKLLCLTVDLGEAAPRSIVSGIAAHFTPESLVGKQVIVVANLPPRKLRGVESQGMILTAHKDNGLELLSVGGPVPPGAKIS